MDYFLFVSVVVSVFLNVCFLVNLYFKEKELENLTEQLNALSEKKEKETLTIDAQQILHDMTHGGAVIRITPIDPTQIFYRAPRG